MDLCQKWKPESRTYRNHDNSLDTYQRQQQKLERRRSCSSNVVLAPEVTEEELRHELALMGFSHVPQERLMEFKRDLEQLMVHQMAEQAPQPKEDQSWGSRNSKEGWPEPTQATPSSGGCTRAEPSCGIVAIAGKEAWAEPPTWTKSTSGAAFFFERGAETGMLGSVDCSSGRGRWSTLPACSSPPQTRPLQGAPSGTRDQAWTKLHAEMDPIQQTGSAFFKNNTWVGCPVNNTRMDSHPLSSPFSGSLLNADDRQVAPITTKERPSSCGGDSSLCASSASRSPQEEPAEGWQRPTMKRKVLRKSEDGRVQISDESTVSEMESEVCCEESWNGESDSERLEMSLVPMYLWTRRREQQDHDRLKSFIRPRLVGNHQKKTDPVAKYQQYKRGWDAFQAPGEKDRKELRWGMREQMLYKAPQPHPRASPVYVPNNYVVPTEKKRSTLRWGVRYDLANGIIPHTKIYPS
ncbi:centriolar and ciliogenesis-associated protein HYLS1 [Microcaecilia unicolor]|uniref:Hydrolethalus syndrome protein 1 n=1 Tax=Microcaecilia unicolor TaxID=1415580 RepID=A0A6P7YLI8_9AMPH|nr:hydrolethalus syndrome protein 1 [Microcaecilia unicolor]